MEVISENSNPSKVHTAVTALLCAVYFILVLTCFQPGICTPDANGYFVQARMMADNTNTYIETESPLQYVNLRWERTGENRYHSKYPPGFSLMAAVAYILSGVTGALLLNAILASLSLLLLYLIVSRWIGPGDGIAAAILLACLPFFNQHTLYGDAHICVIFFLLLSLHTFNKWMEAGRARYAVAAGLCLGFIPAVRYIEALYLPVIGLFILAAAMKNDRARKGIPIFIVSVALPFLWLLLRNRAVFGSFTATGYDDSEEQYNFSIKYFIDFAIPYMRMLLAEGGGFVFAAGCMGIVLLCLERRTRKYGILFAALVVPITIAFMTYYYPPHKQSMRFLLSTFPVYCIAAVWFVRKVTDGADVRFASLMIPFIALHALWGVPQSVSMMKSMEALHSKFPVIRRALEKDVEPGCVVITHKEIAQDLQFTGDWKLADVVVLDIMEGRGPRGKAAPAGDKLPSIEFLRQERYAGLPPEEAGRLFKKDITEFADDKKIYWLVKKRSFEQYTNRFGNIGKMEKIADIELPRPEGENSQGGRGRAHRVEERRPGGSDWEEGLFAILDYTTPLVLAEWKLEKN